MAFDPAVHDTQTDVRNWLASKLDADGDGVVDYGPKEAAWWVLSWLLTDLPVDERMKVMGMERVFPTDFDTIVPPTYQEVRCA